MVPSDIKIHKYECINVSISALVLFILSGSRQYKESCLWISHTFFTCLIGSKAKRHPVKLTPFPAHSQPAVPVGLYIQSPPRVGHCFHYGPAWHHLRTLSLEWGCGVGSHYFCLHHPKAAIPVDILHSILWIKGEIGKQRSCESWEQGWTLQGRRHLEGIQVEDTLLPLVTKSLLMIIAWALNKSSYFSRFLKSGTFQLALCFARIKARWITLSVMR